jgi:amidase
MLARGDPTGWMHGMPQAIKDIALTAGLRSTSGSPLLRDFVPTEDGLMVQRMKAAGCIVVGKTNTPEFGLGSHTFNRVFGATRNAYDPSRTAGGSSGGAAVSLALRMQPVADGSDMMGSLRNPAGFNNVFGFRPSQGRVPYGPLGDQFINHLTIEGPMGRSVLDVARLLAIQAGRDDRAPLSLPGSWPGEPLDLSMDIAKARIGWLGDLAGHLAVEPGILEVCERALGRLSADGAVVDTVQPNFDPHQVWRTWLTLRRWLVAARLRPLWSDPSKREQLKPEAQWEVSQGEALSAADVLEASTDRTAFYQKLLALFDRYDFLALPTAQVWPFDVDLHWPASIAGRPMDTYHRWMETTIYATLAGLPAISVPAGFDARGLPMGLQLIGRPQADLSVLRLARAYEIRATDVIGVRPSLL